MLTSTRWRPREGGSGSANLTLGFAAADRKGEGGWGEAADRRGSDNGSFGRHIAGDALEGEERQGQRKRGAGGAAAGGVAVRADDHSLCAWSGGQAAEGLDAGYFDGGNGNSDFELDE